MTPAERLSTVFQMEQPDRVPVVPAVCNEANATLSGLTQAQVCADSQAALDACLKVFDDFGGWDTIAASILAPQAMQATGKYPLRVCVPGRDLPDDYIFQLAEAEVLRPDDYDTICEAGFDDFYFRDYLWRIADFEPAELPEKLEDIASIGTTFLGELEKRALLPLAADFFPHPFFALSLMRSLVRFTEDLYYQPEAVERTIKKMTAELIPKKLEIARQSGVKRLTVIEERASAFYYPLHVFERFWWPYTREMVDAFWSEGIVTIFHLDSPWDRNLPYFKRLPKGSYVLQLDSTTDIFSAKEVLRDHGILWGDVSAAVLSIGQQEDVEAYVKKLIDEVGDGGGFILGVGCSAPPDCKPENLRSLIDTGKNYERSFSG